MFRRDPATGVILFTEKETDGEGMVTGLKNAAAVAISPEARFLRIVLGTNARGRTRIAADGGGASFAGFGLPLTPTVTSSCRVRVAAAGARSTGSRSETSFHLFKARSG